MTADELIAFEKEMVVEFEAGNIKAPLHLAGGNEEQLINIFRRIRPQDWCLCSWRSHYHCLLKGVPRDELKTAILRGRSIGLCFPQHRVLSSAIVGGICPIALGIAWAIKQKGEDAKVYCFIGDMTAESGIYHECEKYGFDLPIHWVVEDNGLSVCTNTAEVWKLDMEGLADETAYRYILTWPHVGVGKFVKF